MLQIIGPKTANFAGKTKGNETKRENEKPVARNAVKRRRCRRPDTRTGTDRTDKIPLNRRQHTE